MITGRCDCPSDRAAPVVGQRVTLTTWSSRRCFPSSAPRSHNAPPAHADGRPLNCVHRPWIGCLANATVGQYTFPRRPSSRCWLSALVKIQKSINYVNAVGVARFIDASIYRDTFPAIRIAILFFTIKIFFFFYYYFIFFFFPQLFSFRQKDK